MELEYAMVFLSLAAVFGLFMAWGIGANDVANAMATSVGSGAITIRQAGFGGFKASITGERAILVKRRR